MTFGLTRAGDKQSGWATACRLPQFQILIQKEIPMNPTNDKLTQQPALEQAQPKAKRFRIVRLEERIAPKPAIDVDHGPGFTHKCRPSW
jgi:hypothetical protein